MTTITRTGKRWLAVGAAALVAGGGAGLALAQQNSNAAPAPLTRSAPADTHDLAPGSSSIQLPTGAEHGERTDGARDEHADNEREGAGESATDRQQEAAEAAETLKLAQSAKVNAAQAETAALAKVPGWVTEAQLENDNGNAVWEVEVITKDGTQHELKIDAGTAKVLSAQVDQPD